jgi:anti-sigma B factor antagonist
VTQQTEPTEPIGPVPLEVELPDRSAVDTAPAVQIRLIGDLDIATAPRLTAVLDRLFEAGERDVRVDLSGLDFLACAGLHVLEHANRRYRCAGGWLTLINPTEMARRLVAITELDLELRPPQG